MSTIKHEVPYKRGNYLAIFKFIQKKQVVSKNEVIAYAKTINATKFDVDVVMSPKLDNVGSCSARGATYYMEPLAKKAGVKKLDQKSRLRWRTKVLEPNIRTFGEKVESKKVHIKPEVNVTENAKVTA